MENAEDLFLVCPSGISEIRIVPYTLFFKRPAGTSRGVYREHRIWYVIVRSAIDPDRWGIGECAPLPDLSADYSARYETILRKFRDRLLREQRLSVEELRPYPSIFFGLETALLHYRRKTFSLYNTPFARGEKGIQINGLIWMGDYRYMSEQIEAKIENGFRCIKLKIGAVDFEEELSLLRNIRKRFSGSEITLRVDANGAFTPEEALEKLKRLAELDLHSIEQPIRAGYRDEMARLTSSSPLPIALDEELIGVNDPQQKKSLLETVRPQYIILKPTLHGGLRGMEEWIRLAEKLGIGWWITSALESNIGLNAIANQCATYNNSLPQGLGTGALYTNNLEMPLTVRKDYLEYDPNGNVFSLNELL